MTREEFNELMLRLDRLEDLVKTTPYLVEIHLKIINSRHTLIQAFYETYNVS